MYRPLVAGTVTVAMFGSPNTTPCDLALRGTINVTLNCKSIFPTCSGNNWIGTTPISSSCVNSTSLGSSSKNNLSPEILIDYNPKMHYTVLRTFRNIISVRYHFHKEWTGKKAKSHHMHNNRSSINCSSVAICTEVH